MTVRSEHPTTAAIFEEAVAPVLDQLHRVAYRLTGNAADADDLVQETLTRAWRGYRTFEAGSNFRAWLFRIMTNTRISAYRTAARRPAEHPVAVFTEEQHAIAAVRSAESVALEAFADPAVANAVRSLPESLRSVLYYADVEGYKYREIAELLGIPPGTVMSRLHRARQRMRVALACVARRRGYLTDESILGSAA